MIQPSYQRLKKVPEETVYTETYKGYDFVVTDYGPWPNVYVKNKNGFQTPEEFNQIEGGDTICRPCSCVGQVFSWKADYESYLGFSFSHFNDYSGYLKGQENDKKLKRWTTQEIIQFAKGVIDFCQQFNNSEYTHSSNVLQQAALLCPMHVQRKVSCKNCWRYQTSTCTYIRDAQILDTYGYSCTQTILQELRERLTNRLFELDKQSAEAIDKTSYKLAISQVQDIRNDVDKLLSHFKD